MPQLHAKRNHIGVAVNANTAAAAAALFLRTPIMLAQLQPRERKAGKLNHGEGFCHELNNTELFHFNSVF